MTAVEWEKALALQELDITATDLAKEVLLSDETNNNFGSNTNTNNIRFSKMDKYEYEYYSFLNI